MEPASDSPKESPLLGTTYVIPTGPGTYETVICREVKGGNPVVQLKDGRRLIQEAVGGTCLMLWRELKEA